MMFYLKVTANRSCPALYRIYGLNQFNRRKELCLFLERWGLCAQRQLVTFELIELVGNQLISECVKAIQLRCISFYAPKLKFNFYNNNQGHKSHKSVEMEIVRIELQDLN